MALHSGNMKIILDAPGYIKRLAAGLGIAIAVLAPVQSAINMSDIDLNPYTTPLVQPYTPAASANNPLDLQNYYDAIEAWADERKRKEEEEEMMETHNSYLASLSKTPSDYR